MLYFKIFVEFCWNESARNENDTDITLQSQTGPLSPYLCWLCTLVSDPRGYWPLVLWLCHHARIERTCFFSCSVQSLSYSGSGISFLVWLLLKRRKISMRKLKEFTPALTAFLIITVWALSSASAHFKARPVILMHYHG